MGAEDLPRRATRASSGIVQPKVPFDPDPESDRRRNRPASSPAKSPKVRDPNATRKPPPKVIGDRDVFCWTCHKEGPNLVGCAACPRAFHRRCAKLPSFPEPLPPVWACPECQQRERAETVDSRSRATKSLDAKNLCDLLRHAMDRLRSVSGVEHFDDPVDLKEYPTYRDYVVHPIDLQIIENNVNSASYHSTEAFVADVRWLLHNSYVFNAPNSPLTSTARALLKSAKGEVEEIESCPSCYDHANTMPDDEWFGEPCSPPHLLVWAKVLGWPHWPGKMLKIINKGGGKLADIRFFGDHNKANVPLESICLLTKEPPTTSKSRPGGYKDAMDELKGHIKRLEARYGPFEYARDFDHYDPKFHNVFLRRMLPKYQADEEDKCDSPSPKRRRSSSPPELPIISSVGRLKPTTSSPKEVKNTDAEEDRSEEDPEEKGSPTSLDKQPLVQDKESLEELKADMQPLRGLKVKPQEQLLSPAALNQVEGVMTSRKEKNEMLKRVDETLDRVVAGKFTVKPKYHDYKVRPLIDLVETSEDDSEEPRKKDGSFELPQCKFRPTKRGPEAISDVMDWAKSPMPMNNGIIDALDELLVEAGDGADAELVSKVRSLVNLQRQEMAHLYSKVREEASELCEVMGLEAEALEREREEVREIERHLKLTMWCASCLKEAKFYCCWGTSYCSEECQKSDWADHYNVCKQRQPSDSGDSQLVAAPRPLLPKPMLPKPTTFQKRQVFRVVGEGSSGMVKSQLSGNTTLHARPTIQNGAQTPVTIPVKRTVPGAKPLFRVVSNSDSTSILDRGRFVLASSASNNPQQQPVVIGQAAGNGNKFFLIKKNGQQNSAILTQPLKVVSRTNG